MTMVFLNRVFRQPLRRYLEAILLGVLITLASLWRTGFGYRLAYADALTAAGTVLILLGLLLWAVWMGAFDVFGYAASALGRRRYKSLFDYSAAYQEKRKRSGWFFAPFLTVGTVFLLAGLAFFI